MSTGPVALLEGASDVAAVRAVAQVMGVDDSRVRYVDLGGVTHVRALGPSRVLDVLDEMGLRSKLHAFQGQPAWRDRDLHDQLRRFCGTTSGRKEILARELASALAPDEVPEPLRLLVERLTTA